MSKAQLHNKKVKLVNISCLLTVLRHSVLHPFFPASFLSFLLPASFQRCVLCIFSLESILSTDQHPSSPTATCIRPLLHPSCPELIQSYIHVVLHAVLRSRSRGFLARAGADLKFELEPEPIFCVGFGSFFWQVKNEMT